MRKGSGRRWASVAAAFVASTLLCAALMAGCRDSPGAVEDSAPPHPFTVDQVPPGYRLAVAGRGEDVQQWGSDEPSDMPYTVVAVDGRTIDVRLVPWDPEDGGLAGAAQVDGSRGSFELDGSAAVFGEGHDGTNDALVVEVSPTDALRVSAVDSTKDELVAVAQHVRAGDDRSQAPVLVDVPEDWDLIGSADADAVVAARAEVGNPTVRVPGPTDATAVGWIGTGLQRANTARSLVVSVLPGDRADLDALAAPRTGYAGAATSTVRTTVDGRPAVVIDSCCDVSELRTTVVATLDERGDLIVVSARGPRRPDQTQLLAMAGSVRPLDERGWAALQDEAFGGPGLHADPGERELARGEVDGTEWLLQTHTYLPPTGNGYGADPAQDLASDDAAAQWPIVTIDECVKLSSRQRACTSPMGVSAWTRASARSTGVDFPPFVLAASAPGAAQARVEVGGRVTTAPLVPIEGVPLLPGSVGLVFTDLPDGTIVSTCDPATPPDGVSVVRLSFLDPDGNEIACPGP